MQAAFKKTSVSLPAELMDYLKLKAHANGGVPVSRLIAKAVRLMMQKEKK
jgi:metal-responsive CopG/Arc/MetJ family transcriptional regulator